jgi:hypothetical protein
MRVAYCSAMILAGVTAFSGATAPAGTAGERITTIEAVNGLVTAVAQDGSRVSWLREVPDESCAAIIQVRNLATGRDVALRTGTQCSEDVLSLADDRFVYAVSTSQGISETDGRFLTRTIGNRQVRKVCDYALLHGSGVPKATLVARGDAKLSIATAVGRSIETGDGCSKVWLVDRHGGSRPFAQVRPSPFIAVSAGRIAVARNIAVTSGATHRIEIRDSAGRLIRAVHGSGTVRAIALSRLIVAVLLRQPSGVLTLEVRAIASQGSVWSRLVPEGAAPALSAAGATVVYAVGNEIWTADKATKASTLLAASNSTPIGLSIEGRRVVWAESSDAKSVIRSVQVGG